MKTTRRKGPVRRAPAAGAKRHLPGWESRHGVNAPGGNVAGSDGAMGAAAETGAGANAVQKKQYVYYLFSYILVSVRRLSDPTPMSNDASADI